MTRFDTKYFDIEGDLEPGEILSAHHTRSSCHRRHRVLHFIYQLITQHR